MPVADRTLPLAWAGWRTRVPDDWRPLRIGGRWSEGVMTVGDAERSVVQVRWWRPRGRRFDAFRVLARWRRRCGLRRGQEWLGRPPGGPFAATAGYAPGGGSGGGGGVCWCGCAPAAGLVIEVRTGPDLPPARLAWVRERFVQGLDVSAAGQPCEWCVFGARFVSPAGFVYRASALNLGDLSLEFADPAGRRLRLRQVYPADLALARRSLADWLEDSRLRGTLRMVPDGPAEARTLAAGLEGLTRSGRLRLALPPLTRRRFADVAAVQSRRNRLFYAGLDSRGRASPDVAVVETALAAMAGGGPGAGAEER